MNKSEKWNRRLSHSYLGGAVLTLLLLATCSLASAAEKTCFEGQEGTKLMIEGGGSESLGHSYRLKLDWYPSTKEAEAVDALLVFSEPSHELVLAHFVRKPHARDQDFVRSLSPEMTTMIDSVGESHILGEFEKGLSGADGFSVSALTNGQMSTLIDESKVPVGSFGISFLFSLAENGYTVCCSCADGCHECTICVGQPPSAVCGCGGCVIDCRD